MASTSLVNNLQINKGKKNLPLDARVVVSSESMIKTSIIVPYVGMIVYATKENCLYIVTSLGDEIDEEEGTILSSNTRVGSYLPLSEFLALSGGELGTGEGGKKVPDYDF